MLRILIAEDDPDIQELLQAYLSGEGCDTVPAMDGEQVLEQFHGSQIDLVLLDIMMPILLRKVAAVLHRTIGRSGGIPY